MKIYLLRHGVTAFNEEKRYQGRTDVPLSERGKLPSAGQVLTRTPSM